MADTACIVGVIADTHVPDRAPCLPQRALQIFRQAGVTAILHAGDICTPAVLTELEAVAPVYAVRGNRDWFSLRHLPRQRLLEIGGARIGLIHGHGTLRQYLSEKPHILLHGLDARRYIPRLLAAFPEVDVIVFGHLHLPVQERVDGRLIFNPGSACCRDLSPRPPGVGLLRIRSAGAVEGEFIPLSSAAPDV